MAAVTGDNAAVQSDGKVKLGQRPAHIDNNRRRQCAELMAHGRAATARYLHCRIAANMVSIGGGI